MFSAQHESLKDEKESLSKLQKECTAKRYVWTCNWLVLYFWKQNTHARIPPAIRCPGRNHRVRCIIVLNSFITRITSCLPPCFFKTRGYFHGWCCLFMCFQQRVCRLLCTACWPVFALCAVVVDPRYSFVWGVPGSHRDYTRAPGRPWRAKRSICPLFMKCLSSFFLRALFQCLFLC